MSDYVKNSFSKEQQSESNAKEALAMGGAEQSAKEHQELTHGQWLETARSRLKQNKFSNPQFALLMIFSFLFAGCFKIQKFSRENISHPYRKEIPESDRT